MNAQTLKAQIQRSLTLVAESSDELRDLDQALGDGDLGITVSAGGAAVITALDDLSPDATPAEITRAAAKAFANANPSTMAALVAGALLAGSRAWADASDITPAYAQSFVVAAAESIAQRGKTQLGDKTIYDGLAAVAESMAHSHGDRGELDAAIIAASNAVELTRMMQSKRGRAAWLQERSIGLADPGATALLRFLEAWRDSDNMPAN